MARSDSAFRTVRRVALLAATLLSLGACEEAPEPSMCSPEMVGAMMEGMDAARGRTPTDGSSADIAVLRDGLVSKIGTPDEARAVHDYLEQATMLPVSQRRAALAVLAKDIPDGTRLELR